MSPLLLTVAHTFVPSMARCWPVFTGRLAGNSRIGVSTPFPGWTVTVGPVPAAVASALSLFGGLARRMSATRKVTVAGVLSSPKARIRNFVITPSTGAPPE